MSFVDALSETTAPDDPYFDYCLWDYRPVAPPENKFRSLNLLLNSFDVAAADARMVAYAEAIRRAMTPFHTVWGVKLTAGRLSWEYYFYDYRRLQRSRSVSRFIEASRPFFTTDIEPPEARPYFMFSVDVDPALVRGERGLDEISMYIGNVGSSVSSGICYTLSRHSLELKNFYFFFDAGREMEDIRAKVACSAHLDLPRVRIDELLIPELRTCKTIVVANKKNNDSIYFSRITVDQLIFFLARMGYPENIVSYVSDRKNKLDHLLYDVGFDYVMSDGEITVLKSGYYGII